MNGHAHVRANLWLAEQALKVAGQRLAGLLAIPEALRNPAAIEVAEFNLDTARRRLEVAAEALAARHPPAPIARPRYGRHRPQRST